MKIQDGNPPKRTSIAWLPLLIAISVVTVFIIYPVILVDKNGKINHLSVYCSLWAMTAGFVRGVGFIPRSKLLQHLFSSYACALGLTIAMLRLLNI